VEKHSRTPATSGRIGVLGTRRPLSVAVVPPRPPRPVTGDHQRAAHGVPFGKRRCLGVEETRARRPGERRRPVHADPAALGPYGGGARPKRRWRFTSEHWSGSGARQQRCSAACGAGAADPHPHGGGRSSRDQGRCPFETNPERPAPLLFYTPVTMDGLVWTL